MSSKQTFRSTIDYSENIGVDGCCCVPDSKSGGATRTTYSSCVELGGFFTPIPQDADPSEDCSSFECPNLSQTGCCCSCSFMTAEQRESWLLNQDQQVGVRDNVTPCKCTELGGNFVTKDVCDALEEQEVGTQAICYYDGGIAPGDPSDVRWPHACCIYDEETDSVRCENVCTPEECAANNLSVYYDDGSVCSYIGPDGQPPRSCSLDGLLGGEDDNEEGDERSERSMDLPNLDDIKDRVSSCIFVDGGNNVLCGNYTKSQCDTLNGTFSYFDKEDNPIRCGEFPALTSGGKGPYKITQDEADNLDVGQDFYGIGIYCGVYTPGMNNSQGSEIKGVDAFSGPTSTIYSKAEGIGKSKAEKWAIILGYEDVAVGNYGVGTNLKETSKWVSKYNFYSSRSLVGDLVELVKKHTVNGIDGWTIPSVYEAGFIQRNLFDNPDAGITIAYNRLTDGYNGEFDLPTLFSYLTSTLVKLRTDTFVQSYNFSSGHEGATTKDGAWDVTRDGRNYHLMSSAKSSIILNTLTDPLNVRLIKTIPIV